MKAVMKKYLMIALTVIIAIMALMAVGYCWGLWCTAPKTFYLDDSELYVKVVLNEDKDTVRFYFNNSYENTYRNYIDISPVYLEMQPVIINVLPEFPKKLYIYDAQSSISNKICPDYDMILTQIVYEDIGPNMRLSNGWSDSTIFKQPTIKYIYIPYTRGFWLYNDIDGTMGEASLAFKLFGNEFHIRI